MRPRPFRQSRTSASKRGPRWSMMGCAIARTMRSGTSVGPGICRNGRPDMLQGVYHCPMSTPTVRDEIPTPALLLDLDRFERNLARMAEHARRAGKGLRPHAKTHRCPEIAHRQIAAGALGVACAKLGEAEVMAAAGVRGLLITTEVVAPAAIRRLLRLVSAAPDTLVVIDNAENVAELGREAVSDGVTVNILVDIDVGGGRTGMTPGDPALALARAVVAQPALRF